MKDVWLASSDGTISVWTVDYNCKKRFVAHEGSAIDGLLLVPSSSKNASEEKIWSWSSLQKTICLWDSTSQLLWRTIECKDRSPLSSCICQCGVLFGTEEGIVLFFSQEVESDEGKDTENQLSIEWKAHDKPIRSIVYLQAQNQAWTASDDCTVKCWDLSSSFSCTPPSLVRVLTGHQHPITTITQIGPLFAMTGDASGYLFLWGANPSIYPGSLDPNRRLQRLFIAQQKNQHLMIRMAFWNKIFGRSAWVSCANNSISIFSMRDELDDRWFDGQETFDETKLKQIKELLGEWVEEVVEEKVFESNSQGPLTRTASDDEADWGRLTLAPMKAHLPAIRSTPETLFQGNVSSMKSVAGTKSSGTKVQINRPPRRKKEKKTKIEEKEEKKGRNGEKEEKKGKNGEKEEKKGKNGEKEKKKKKGSEIRERKGSESRERKGSECRERKGSECRERKGSEVRERKSSESKVGFKMKKKEKERELEKEKEKEKEKDRDLEIEKVKEKKTKKREKEKGRENRTKEKEKDHEKEKEKEKRKEKKKDKENDKEKERVKEEEKEIEKEKEKEKTKQRGKKKEKKCEKKEKVKKKQSSARETKSKQSQTLIQIQITPPTKIPSSSALSTTTTKQDSKSTIKRHAEEEEEEEDNSSSSRSESTTTPSHSSDSLRDGPDSTLSRGSDSEEEP